MGRYDQQIVESLGRVLHDDESAQAIIDRVQRGRLLRFDGDNSLAKRRMSVNIARLSSPEPWTPAGVDRVLAAASG